MFDLHRPCANCPFKKGQGEKFQLPPERLEEIKTAVGFLCHKTLESKRRLQCVGFMAVMQREWGGSPIMQLAERLGGVDFSRIDPDHEAYDSWADVLRAHNITLGESCDDGPLGRHAP